MKPNLGGADGRSEGGKIIIREGMPPAEEFCCSRP